MKRETWFKKYAFLVLNAGVNLKRGQKLQIRVAQSDYDFARLLATEAYTMGASYVSINVHDNHLLKQRIIANSNEELCYSPQATIALSHEQVADAWAFISIANTSELDALNGVDSQKLGILTKAASMQRLSLQKSLMSDQQPWCVIACPNDEWAAKVLGDGAKEAELREVLTPILRLDADEPAKAWQENVKTLKERCRALNDQQFRSISFKSQDTDITFGLSPHALWKGGGSCLPNERKFLPNLPTEEVYTLPDRNKTNGYVKVKKPVNILGVLVDGIHLTFKDGKVTKFSAEKNENILEEFLNTDDGARYLGELALVDAQSPITQSGLLFFNILYDENASSHMALGKAYPSCLNTEALNSGKDLEQEFGCNNSLVHTDFMIGCDTMLVSGMNKNNEEITIMKDGNFVLS